LTFYKHDGGWCLGFPFTLKPTLDMDSFHPDAAGQAVFATQTWREGFWSPSG